MSKAQYDPWSVDLEKYIKARIALIRRCLELQGENMQLLNLIVALRHDETTGEEKN